MRLPAITICMITYNRPVEIRKTIAAIHQNLTYAGKVHLTIADDCSPGSYADDLRAEGLYVLSTPQNGGWGRNANYALGQITSDLILMCEDDYILTQPIDLTPYAALLACNANLGMVRLDGVAGHKARAQIKEWDVSALLPDYRQGIGLPGRVGYWELEAEGPELWLYSNRPHLKHRRFHQSYGKYPEGLRLGETEESFAHMVKDGLHDPTMPRVVVPLELSVSYWDHIGVSYQHTEFDK